MTENRKIDFKDRDVSSRLGEIFTLINMTDLPAMSPHVRELMALAYNSKAGSDQLAAVILKDYSLTNKVLQLVNSAYYGLSQKVSSISRAVTIIGFEAIRNMACGIAIFDDFVKSGVERDGISKLMTKSFLSGIWARTLCASRGINVQAEEVFICSLLHNLGRVIVCIYLPEVHNLIEEGRRQGLGNDEAAWMALGEISLAEIGREVARFWNMSDKIVASMEVAPPLPESTCDEAGIARCLADFSNRFTEFICDRDDFEALFVEYGPFFGISAPAAVKLMLECVDESAGFSRAVGYGLGRLKVRAHLVRLVEEFKARRSLVQEEEEGGKVIKGRGGRDELENLQRQVGGELTGAFDMKHFCQALVRGLNQAMGFDRAVVGLIRKVHRRPSLLCRFFSGNVDGGFAHLLEKEFERDESPLRIAFATRKEMVLLPEVLSGVGTELAPLLAGRRVYLLPLVYRSGVSGLIYLDRQGGSLSERKIKVLKILRQYGEMAIKKYRVAGGRNSK